MPDTTTKSPTILVIDDDAEIRYSLSRVVSSRGYQVAEAASGEQGIALVKKGPPPDLVFLDVRMSGMSGIEALQHIRSANPKQLVVLMTAYGTAQTAIEAMKYGAFDYVMKPFDPEKVLALAEKALKAHADRRALDLEALPPRRETVHRRQLRRDPRQLNRKRTLRTRERLVHRRDGPATR